MHLSSQVFNELTDVWSDKSAQPEILHQHIAGDASRFASLVVPSDARELSGRKPVGTPLGLWLSLSPYSSTNCLSGVVLHVGGETAFASNVVVAMMVAKDAAKTGLLFEIDMRVQRLPEGSVVLSGSQ